MDGSDPQLKGCPDSPLCQVTMASFMPLAVFVAAAATTSLAMGISLARLNGGLQDPPQGEATSGQTSGSLSLWTQWQLLVGLAGFVVFPQVRPPSSGHPSYPSGQAPFLGSSIISLRV